MDELTLSDIDNMFSEPSVEVPADELTLNDLDALFAPKEKKTVSGRRKLSRTSVQYATLPKNHLVRYTTGASKRCESLHCGAPTQHSFRHQPMCLFHLVMMLVHELNRYSKHGTVEPDEENEPLI